MRGRILVVEDVPEMAELIRDNLEFEGFEVALAPTGEEGLKDLRAGGFDLVILDINLPGMDGFEFLERLRKDSTLPVIIVSARDGEGDLVTGLGMGADEYIAKPFSPRALAARVRALLRRTKQYADSAARPVTCFGPYLFDRETLSLSRDGRRLSLSAREAAVLLALAEAEGRPLKPEDIFDAAWSQAYGDITAVGVYIQRLRRKLEDDPAAPRYIQTERGLGYRLECGPEEADSAPKGGGS